VLYNRATSLEFFVSWSELGTYDEDEDDDEDVEAEGDFLESEHPPSVSATTTNEPTNNPIDIKTPWLYRIKRASVKL
jgi:hypothetical protein